MEQQILTGEAPDPTRIPSGCRFHPRCPLVESGEAARLGIQERCRGEDPLMLPACHAVAPPRRRRAGEPHDRDAALQLVHRSRGARARARAAVRPRWQYAGPHRRARRAGLLLHAAGRPRCPLVVVRDREGDAARVHQRLPPPRRRGRVRTGHAARRSSATTTPGPTASTARCARRRARRPTRISTATSSGCGRPRSIPGGRSSSSTPTPARAAGRDARASCRRSCAAPASTSTRSRSTPRVVHARRQLEDRRRELPRVLPLRGRPPELQRGDRRAPGRATCSSATRPSAATTRPARRRATATASGDVRASSTCLAEHQGQRDARAGEPVDRPAGARRPDRHRGLPRLLLRRRRRPGLDRRLPRARLPGRATRTACWSSRFIAACARARSSSGRLMLPSEELIGEFQGWVARNLDGAGRL